MPYPNSQDPQSYGWGAPGEGGRTVIDFTYQGLAFPQGLDARVVRIYRHLLNKLVPLIPGGLYRPGGSSQLTSGNINDWGQWGGELRAKRGSGNQSLHSWWIVIDVNSGANPFNTNTPAPSPYRLPLGLQALLDSWFPAGFFLAGQEWGDWMHIELHASPAEVAQWEHDNPTLGITEGGSTANPSTPTDNAPTPDDTDLLEWIMSLPGAPANLTYSQLLADIAQAILHAGGDDFGGAKFPNAGSLAGTIIEDNSLLRRIAGKVGA